MSDGEVSQKWYGNSWVVAVLIWVFFPVGLFLMWKYANWNKKLKWGISGIFALLLLYGVIASVTAKVPVITLDAFKDNQTVTADSILVKGKVDPSSSQITINGKNIEVSSDGSFSYTVPLDEGANTIKVEADNIGKTSQIAKAVNRQLSSAEVAAKQKAEEQTVTKATPTPTTKAAVKPVSTETPKSTPTPSAPGAPTATVSQRNALSKAKDYLSYTAFSHDGLVSQLEYEQFSTADATYGADNSGADWNQQAAKKAKDYMSYSSFSRGSLIEQLEYDKFTPDQAAYGANSVGL